MQTTPPTLEDRKRAQSPCNTSEFMEWEHRTRLSYEDGRHCPMCNRACIQDDYVELTEENIVNAYLRKHCSCGFVWTSQTKHEAEALAVVPDP